MQVRSKKTPASRPPRQLKGEGKMALWLVLSIILTLGAALGAPGNFGDTPGLNGSDTQTQNSKGINPVQHSE
jgi:hypothetical protein